MLKLKSQAKRWMSKLTDTTDFKTAVLTAAMLLMVFGSLGCLAYVLTYRLQRFDVLSPFVLENSL